MAGGRAKKTMKHLHFQIVGCDNLDKIDGRSMYKDATVVELNCETEEEAMQRAKEIVKKNYYFLEKVWECHTSDSIMEDVKILQLEGMMKLLKKFA